MWKRATVRIPGSVAPRARPRARAPILQRYMHTQRSTCLRVEKAAIAVETAPCRRLDRASASPLVTELTENNMLGAELDLFGGALVKRDSQGQYVPIEPKDLAGVSVALYFGKKNHTKSAAVASVLKQFYLTTNCSYQPKSVEVIYVSLDEDEKTFEEARAQMPWCSVEYRSDLRKNLINRYKITDHFLAFRKAKIPTTQCPHIIIIGPHGEEAGRLDVSKGGPEAFLLNWDYRYNRWPGTPSIPSTPSTGMAWT